MFKSYFPNNRNLYDHNLDWLALMQHYGLPTRLLDWSTNMLVGLYFAVNKDEDIDGSLYVLDAGCVSFLGANFLDFLSNMVEVNSHDALAKMIVERLRFSYPENDFDVSLGGSDPMMREFDFEHIKNFWSSTGQGVKPIDDVVIQRYKNALSAPNKRQNIKIDLFATGLFQPSRLNDRLIAQHGVFTVHDGKYVPGWGELISHTRFEDVCAYWSSKFNKSKDILIKINIKKDFKKDILDELDVCGISEATLFPEMEYQSKRIRAKHKVKN